MLLVGLALSAAAHVLVLAVLGGLLERTSVRDARLPDPLVVEPPTGMRAVELAVVTPSPFEVEAPRRDEPDPVPPRPLRPAPQAPPEAAPARPAARRTPAERFAPRLIDPRLWRPMVLVPREPTFDDVQRRIAAAIELLSDSALAEVERAVRALDWTVEDADGGRWGISPGLLHLGKITLPLPIAFPVAFEAEARRAEWYEVEMQADRELLIESFEQRVRAIRERRDRERAERRTANGGS